MSLDQVERPTRPPELAWLYAAHNPGVKAGVAWYGKLVGQASDLQPKHPIDVVASLAGPMLGLYGGDDPGIQQDTVDAMNVALVKRGNAAASQSQIVVYPGAPHAFHADYRPSYRPAPADDGWKRCLAWFKANGAA